MSLIPTVNKEEGGYVDGRLAFINEILEPR